MTPPRSCAPVWDAWAVSIAIQGLARVPRPCENILIEDGEFWTDVANVLRIGYEGETVGISTQNAIENNVIYGRLPCRYLAAG